MNRVRESLEVVAQLLNDKTFATWVCKVRAPLPGNMSQTYCYGEKTEPEPTGERRLEIDFLALCHAVYATDWLQTGFHCGVPRRTSGVLNCQQPPGCTTLPLQQHSRERNK